MNIKLNKNEPEAFGSKSQSKEHRSKRTIKKTSKVLSMLDEGDHNSINSEPNEGDIKQMDDFEDGGKGDILRGGYPSDQNDTSDIVMEGSLIYRYEIDQIELEGFWSINNDLTREKFSYLLLKNKEKNLICPVKSHEIDLSIFINLEEEVKKYFNTVKDEYNLHVCSTNLYECLLIPNSNVFRTVLNLISGEYHGFFLYYNKTIEDRFYLKFNLEGNQVRINGEGTNNLGNFNIIGYINLYMTKEELTYKNSIDSEVINLGEFKFTRIYNAFNPNENYRVIKSYQHRKKKGTDNSESNSNI